MHHTAGRDLTRGASNRRRQDVHQDFATMAHCLGKLHGFDRHILGRVNSAIMLGLVGSGLLACAAGAFVYDIGRLFSVW